MCTLACGPLLGRGGGLVTDSLRPVAVPFVAATPGGARVRARLHLSPEDEAVLRVVGAHLGSLAGKDLAARCIEVRRDARGRPQSRAVRKRALTAESSSRWAGAITRTSEDQVRLAEQNLRAERTSLLARIRRIEARLAIQAASKSGRMRGYATAAERPGAAPDHPGARDRTQETRRPTRSPAATRYQDRTASLDHGRQPGSPRPFGATD
jgi:hypothetical protein